MRAVLAGACGSGCGQPAVRYSPEASAPAAAYQFDSDQTVRPPASAGQFRTRYGWSEGRSGIEESNV